MIFVVVLYLLLLLYLRLRQLPVFYVLCAVHIHYVPLAFRDDDHFWPSFSSFGFFIIRSKRALIQHGIILFDIAYILYSMALWLE